jgi:type II secretory pathway predicted ATPase ExeA
LKPDFADIDATMDRGAATDRAAAPTTPSAADADARPVSTSAESRSRLHWFIGTADGGPPDPGALTYEPHFGLREKPFSLSSDPRFFYSHSSHGVSFDTLAAGIRRREGILALMGEVGTGKTTLCRAVLQALDRRTFAAFVPDPFLSREDLLKTLLVDFGVVSVDEIRSGRLRGASRTDLSYPLYDFLASLQPLKAFAVVMIDEAHNLTSELLEEIRILSDLEKNRQKLLEVMLIGQPELQTRLASNEMRQLSQRVSLRCELVPLVPEEVRAYVGHRLTVAGNDGRVRFTDQAIECVATASSGIPRLVNLICDRALLKAAWSGTTIVNAEHVVWAATDLQMPTSRVTEPMLLPQPAALAAPPPASPIETTRSAMPEVPAEIVQSDTIVQDEEPPAAPEPHAPASSIDVHVGPPATISSVHVGTTAPAAERLQPEEPGDAWPRRRWLTVTAVCVVLAGAAGVWATRHSLGDWLGRQQPPSATPVEAKSPPPAAVAPSRPAPEPEPVAPPAPKAALQIATFQSATRAQQAVDQLRAAGYRAYSVELAPQNGERMLTVFLGPYSDVSDAERDLDAVRRIPDYVTARVVPLVPALLPPDAPR